MRNQRQTARANSMNLPLPTDRALRCQVLECASPLALWISAAHGDELNGPPEEKRHRTGALQNDAASRPGPGAPFCAAVALFAWLAVCPVSLQAQPATSAPGTNEIRILKI